MLTLIAMEPPLKAMGPNSGDNIRDAKVAVLKAMKEIKLEVSRASLVKDRRV